MKKIVRKMIGVTSLAVAALMIANVANATIMDINIATTYGNITGTIGLGSAVSGGASPNITSFDLTVNDPLLNQSGLTSISGTSVTAGGSGDALCMTGSDIFDWCSYPSTDIGPYETNFITAYGAIKLLSYPQYPELSIYVAGFTSGVTENYISSTSITLTPQATVPEPSTLALFGIGLVGLGTSRKRKRKA